MLDWIEKGERVKAFEDPNSPHIVGMLKKDGIYYVYAILKREFSKYTEADEKFEEWVKAYSPQSSS